jgi:hypothetical protein
MNLSLFRNRRTAIRSFASGPEHWRGDKVPVSGRDLQRTSAAAMARLALGATPA